MLENQQIARLFSEIADMLAIQGELVRRINAYRRAADAICDQDAFLDHRRLPSCCRDKVAEARRELEKEGPSRRSRWACPPWDWPAVPAAVHTQHVVPDTPSGA